jgi:lipooligosaccharide transport system ATP-binding protein
VEALSGGYKRRLAVAMSLVNRPELLILDEPTTGLDPAVRHTLWSRIRALREGGTTVLLTTHYMDEAERLCDRVAIISHGRVVCEDTPAELIRSHLAAEALELECSAAEEAALLGETRLVRQRLRSEGHLMLFSDDATALADTIRHRDGGDARPLILRPTNLEDVFLAVTGGSLEHGEDDGVGGGA